MNSLNQLWREFLASYEALVSGQYLVHMIENDERFRWVMMNLAEAIKNNNPAVASLGNDFMGEFVKNVALRLGENEGEVGFVTMVWIKQLGERLSKFEAEYFDGGKKRIMDPLVQYCLRRFKKCVLFRWEGEEQVGDAHRFLVWGRGLIVSNAYHAWITPSDIYAGGADILEFDASENYVAVPCDDGHKVIMIDTITDWEAEQIVEDPTIDKYSLFAKAFSEL